MALDETTSKSRPGRPRAGERAERERRILDAALAELTERGYDRLTMLSVAQRAGASKETLYTWFGNKVGLFTALITRNADESARRIERALAVDDHPRNALIGYATGLLRLLTGADSVALNRAAMNSPELAEVLLANGRHRIGPLVETYLADLADAGELDIDDPAEAFQLLYGLVIRDTQVRVLLGESAPDGAELARDATQAVDRFLHLTGSS